MKASECLKQPGDVARRESDGSIGVCTLGHVQGKLFVNLQNEHGQRARTNYDESDNVLPELLHGDDWEPLISASEADTLQARVAELEAENEALRSGAAFVGEELEAGDDRPPFYWHSAVGSDCQLMVRPSPVSIVPERLHEQWFRYTGPTTAPLPNDTCSKLKDPDATLKKPAEKFKADDPPEDTTPLPELIDGDYSREMLIAICEAGVVPHAKWMNRDTPEAHAKLGLCWVMLKAGCEFTVTLPVDEVDERSCVTDDRTIWLYVKWDSFATVDHGGPAEEQHFYLPTPKRLRERVGGDWY